MSKVYLSFLGLGTYDEIEKRSRYRPTRYELNGKKSSETDFVQVAEIEILGADRFKRIIIVATRKSNDAHFTDLEAQLIRAGAGENQIQRIIISENMAADGQWEWFEKMLATIEPEDELTIDLTHGYRASSIVLSAAINFLQKARNIQLDAVYYGAYEKDRGLAPIIDMKDFYVINEWAEAVSRLVEDADARKIAQVSDRTASFQAGELNDKKLIRALEDLTDAVRNVDVNNVPHKAGAALEIIEKKKSSASITGRILLGLVIDKFTSLTWDKPWTGRYDAAYFVLQLQVIRLLLDHKLFMQAYTAMREFIGSIGMIGLEKIKLDNADGRRKRKRFADVFVNMLQYEESAWDFPEAVETSKNKLMPYYDQLKQIGVEPILRGFSKELADYRNGFDHAWTMKKGAFTDIKTKGVLFFNQLNEVVSILKDNGVFKLDAP